MEAQDKALLKFVGDNLPTADEGKILVVRTGKAEDIRYKNKVRLSGTISAPAVFFAKRKGLHDPNKCHVIYDKLAGTIKLVVDENFEKENYEVVGKLESNPDLEPFGINEEKLFGIKDLMQVLKFNRIHFADKDANAALVMSLQNFKAKVDLDIENSNDQRGNHNVQRTQKLESGLKENFVLKMPIYKGGAEKTFVVDILCQVTDGGVTVWLESRELKELQVSSADSIMQAELDSFKELVCIEQ